MQRERTRWVLAIGAVLALGGCPTPPKPLFEPQAGPRLVMASVGSDHHVRIAMSADGLVWTEPQDAAMAHDVALSQTAPGLFNDGTLYHLYWMTPTGDVRYATSRDAASWLPQSAPLATLPPGSRPAFVHGKHGGFALIGGASGVVAVDLQSSTARRTTIGPGTRWSAAADDRRYLAALVDGGGHLSIFTSNDGAAWSHTSDVPGAYGDAHLTRADGAFWLATRETGRCRAFTSSDGAAWTELPQPICSDSETGLAAARLAGTNLFFENWGDQRITVVHGGVGPEDTYLHPQGQFAIASGGGPALAALRFDRVTIDHGDDQDPSIVVIGFHVRVGQPGSARATWSGRLAQHGIDLDAGQSAPLPPWVSPFAWIVTPAKLQGSPADALDVMGAVVVGIERGDCPEGSIHDQIEAARAALQLQLEQQLAQGTVTALQDAATRQAAIDAITTAVKAQLGGRDGGFLGDLACGFNRDEQLHERLITLFATDAVDNDDDAGSFRLSALDPDPLDVPRVIVSSGDGTEVWRLQVTRRFLPTP